MVTFKEFIKIKNNQKQNENENFYLCENSSFHKINIYNLITKYNNSSSYKYKSEILNSIILRSTKLQKKLLKEQNRL